MSEMIARRTKFFTSTRFEIDGDATSDGLRRSGDLIVDDDGDGKLQLDLGVDTIEVRVEDLQAVAEIVAAAIDTARQLNARLVPRGTHRGRESRAA